MCKLIFDISTQFSIQTGNDLLKMKYKTDYTPTRPSEAFSRLHKQEKFVDRQHKVTNTLHTSEDLCC